MNSLVITTLDIDRDLLNSIAAEAEVIVLDSTENIQERITEILGNYNNLSSVHFVLPERDGDRANTELDRLLVKELKSDRLSSFFQERSLLELNQSFAEDATIFFHEFNPQTNTFDTLQELAIVDSLEVPEARNISLKPDELNNSLDTRLVLEDNNERDDAALTTDLDDYPPGATAIITGENFDPGETIELQVLHTDDIPNTGGGHDPWQVTDGGAGDLDGVVDGNFQTTWYVNPDDSADSAFELTATGLSSGETATYHFTDAGADFSIDFAAAAPQIYDHDTGGGAFEDKTINEDAVESLEGGDFAVGDIVSYYFNVNVKPDAVDRFPQTIEIDVSFLVNTTGATGVSHRDIVGVSANYWTGELDAQGEIDIIADTAIIDDDSTTAWIVPGTKIYENKVTGETYTTYTQAAGEQGAVVSATVRLNDLEPGEQVVLRVDTLLDALAGSSPTGNLQGFVTGARVISSTDDPIINVGNQTIPFKLTDEIKGIPELSPGIKVDKVVTSDLSGLTVNYGTHTTNSVDADTYYDTVNNEKATVLEGSTVRYIYKITNTGNTTASLYNLVDDNGTPANTTDDIYLFYSSNQSDILWNRQKQSNGNPGNTELTSNNGFTILGTGFLNDNDATDGVLTNLQDLDNDNKTDPKSLQAGESVYVYYDVTINDTNRTALQSSTNTATATSYVDPNGGGQQGIPVTDTDTANVQILPSAGTTATLSGYSYLDLNNNGIKDAGESGIVGALITLSNGATTRTDMNGFYSFTSLAAGTYTIIQTQPLNYYDGKETAGTGGGTVNNTTFSNTISGVTVNAGNYYQNYNFGELLPADIAGVAYYDLNGDGNRQDTETGRAGIEVTLTGTNDFGQAVNVAATTDSSGRYYFGGLRPSDATGYTITFTGSGAVGSGDVGQILGVTEGTNDVNTDNTISSINLAAGDSGVNYDFGVAPATIGGTISGTVYQDTGIYSSGVLTGTDNGIINDTDANSFSTTPTTGEKRIAGVTISLYDNTNTLITTTKTDINGNYSFTGLTSGTYRVEETQPQYFDPSANNGQGGFVNYLDGKEASPTGTTTTNDQISSLVIANSTTNLTGNNFGELPPASISGYVFLDTKKDRVYGLDAGQSITVDGTTTTNTGNSYNNYPIAVRNGELDNDEFGIAGVEIQLTGTNDLGQTVNTTTTTDANGYYRFDGLRPSNSSGYTVTQRQPSAYNDGTYDANSDKTFTASDVNPGNILGTKEVGTYTDPGYTANTYQDNFSSINVAFGQSAVDYNFPEATSNGLIKGKVYVDANNNGSYDLGESGISGVTLTLNTNATVVTDADGDYFFSVAAGTYSITETQPAAYNNGIQNSSNVVNNVVVTAGQTNSSTTNNFGEVVSSISGFVKLDTDGNSTTTTNDQSNLSNIEIQLLNSGGTVVATTRTGFDGSYKFTNLLAGTYSIQEIDTVAYSDASPAASFSGSGTSSPNSNGINDRIADISLGTAQNLVN
jgi:protocatechuate 3,4-dioxygenase beta subunit